MKKIVFLGLLLLLCLGGLSFFLMNREPDFSDIPAPVNMPTATETLVLGSVITQPPTSPTPLPQALLIPMRTHVAQTFNNCGPATLSMLLSYTDIAVSQKELGEILRPYQHPKGNNDDKTVFLQELVEESQKRGLVSFYRPNGTIDTLKQFISSNIPVVVMTWLKPNEDIAHYRLIRGYDDRRNILIQDDSYHGKNLTIPYDQINTMWQPFNYVYFIAVKENQEETVRKIIDADLDKQIAWERTLTRAKQEESANSKNPYPVFNQAVALFYLGNYQEAVSAFEKVQNRLPRRMLWYQIEPIEAYQKLGDFNKVFTITDQILGNNNRAFSELYLLRGESYEVQGQKEKAKVEFEKALLYNRNSTKAREALSRVW